ncbi:MAG: HrpE/YscL family type III secretion apparatus protein [Burkholderiales bacterium]|nr:HrpE/YscL family type III secretion apparatus protein [Burkholderiales bacterium]
MRYINDKQLDKILNADEYISSAYQEADNLLQTTREQCETMINEAREQAEAILQNLSTELLSITTEKINQLESTLINDYNTIVQSILNKIGFKELIHYDNVVKSVIERFVKIQIISISANHNTIDRAKEELGNFQLENNQQNQILFNIDNTLQDETLKLETSYGLLYINVNELYSKIISLNSPN